MNSQINTLILVFCLFHRLARGECVPAKIFIETVVPSGMFLRVNPMGNKVIYGDLRRDGKNRTPLLQISEQEGSKKYTISEVKTPFHDEAYAVDTLSDEWTLIASPDHDGKMHYYELEEVLKHGDKAKHVYADFNDGVYHSTAELKGSQDQKRRIRTILQHGERYTDYEYVKGNELKPASMRPLQSGRICQNLLLEELSPSERVEEEQNRKTSDRLLEEMQVEQFNLKSQGKTQADIDKSEVMKKIWEQLKKIKFNDKVKNYNQPILNKTGDKVAAVVGTSLKVFRINEDMSCKEIHDLGTYAGKARFSYPRSDGTEFVAYKKKLLKSGRLIDRVIILNMKTGVETITPLDWSVSSFTEFTKDGRIFFSSYSSDGHSGYWWIDPNQMTPTGEVKIDPTTCIQRMDSSNPSSKKENPGAK